VCHSDLHFVEGKYSIPMPAVLGHEAAGTVEAVGEQVTYVRPGDTVVTCLSVFCGHCEFCTTGRPFSCQNPEVARGDDEASASTSFFIVVGDASELDGVYTAFGRVTAGMAAVDQIAAAPTEGETPTTRIPLHRVRLERD